MTKRQMQIVIVITAILGVQFVASLWHINDSFIDGRYHYNWGPPFWLMNAKLTNEVGVIKSYFGVVHGVTRNSEGTIEKVSYYESHPQLIGPLFATWTKIFGYAENSARLFSITLTLVTTAIFFFSFNKIFGLTFASIFSILFASAPLIYIYGKKLDQEALVLLFLSLTFFGYLKFFFKEKWSELILFIGFLGMMLSDWSGFVFSFLTASVLFLVLYKDKERLKKVFIIIVSSVFFGLFLFILQRYLQEGSSSLSTTSLTQQYFGLWKYRAGIQGSGIPWTLWLLKQYVNLLLNFSIVFLLMTTVGFLFSIKVAIQKKLSKEEKYVILFAAAIFIGQLLYILLLQQASFVHLYYQYYLSFVFSFFAVWFIRELAQKTNHPNKIFIIIGVLAIIFSIWRTYNSYTQLLYKDINGDETDITLIKSIKDIPLELDVIAIGDNNEQDWFSGPNIQYYTSRVIAHYPLDHAPFAPYTFVPIRFSQKVVNFMKNGIAFGSPVPAKIATCSTNYCLIKVEKTQ